jgi:acylphosphatase
MNALHLMIYGRVQGVWFRASTQEVAIKEGVNGWVRNTYDGAVEVYVEGAPDAVQRFLQWCYHGPVGARVDHIDVEEIPSPEGIEGFKIRY